MLRNDAIFMLFIFKSISLSHLISCVLFPNDHVVLYCKIPHITHTTYDIQMYTLETVTSSDPIITCCRIAAKTGFILFCTWEKIVELNMRNQAHLFFSPLFLQG